MDAGVTGFEMRRTIALIVMRCGPMMLVRSEPMKVLGMIVIGVCVDVQGKPLTRT